MCGWYCCWCCGGCAVSKWAIIKTFTFVAALTCQWSLLGAHFISFSAANSSSRDPALHEPDLSVQATATTVSPGSLAAQKVALCNILYIALFTLLHYFFKYCCKTKVFIHSLKKVLPLKFGHPRLPEAYHQEQIQEGPVYGECLIVKMHLWAAADLYELYFVFPGCRRVAILKSEKNVVVKKKRTRPLTQVFMILGKALFSWAAGIFGLYNYAENYCYCYRSYIICCKM